MVHYCPSRSSVCTQAKPRKRRSGKQAERISGTFDSFVSSVYLPYAKLYKKSWDLDESIARRHISPTFGEVCLADINRGDVEIWFQRLAEKGLAASTCNRILAVLKKICALALEYGVFPSGQSPCTKVSSLKVSVVRERYLTDEMAQRLIDELDRSDRQEARVAKLLLLTGARKSEILNAQWVHVNLEQRLLIVPDSKSGKPRHIALSDEAIAVFRSLQRKAGCPWVFPGRDPGKPLSDIYIFWNKLRCRLGLRDVRIHDLRHTFASLLVNSGHSLYAVQRLLGHSDPRTTMRYAHLGQASLLAATQTVSARLVRSGERKNSTSHQPSRHSICPGSKRASPYAGTSV